MHLITSSPPGSQGPAELRRLLTWASKKRNGGIIIIDQAESALGSRARVESDKLGDNKVLGDRSASRRYSRDCLNVLLSMTGTFGNIMLILTTSNPSKLDEAVLDRMDEIIYLPLPSALERSILLRNKFFGYFELLDNVDEHKKRLSRNKLLSSSCTASTKAPFAVNFDAENCVFDLAVKTRGLSGRELEKIILGVMFKTHASVSGILDMELWKKETAALIKAIVVKHMLKCS
jgi:SpoVK/Ycf46/Vps4 family AAA+-type ATPase